MTPIATRPISTAKGKPSAFKTDRGVAAIQARSLL
jgi:hypothetical protein